jgi:hypothetical protein
MNKAITREPDSDDALCPRCGTRGLSVTKAAIEAHARPEFHDHLAPGASYCPTPTCDAVYFDAFERVITADQLVAPVYPKDPAAPICPCFSATTAVIDDDIAEGVVRRTRALVEQSKSPAARCDVMSVDGRSCAAEVQRYYMRNK